MRPVSVKKTAGVSCIPLSPSPRRLLHCARYRCSPTRSGCLSALGVEVEPCGSLVPSAFRPFHLHVVTYAKTLPAPPDLRFHVPWPSSWSVSRRARGEYRTPISCLHPVSRVQQHELCPNVQWFRSVSRRVRFDDSAVACSVLHSGDRPHSVLIWHILVLGVTDSSNSALCILPMVAAMASVAPGVAWWRPRHQFEERSCRNVPTPLPRVGARTRAFRPVPSECSSFVQCRSLPKRPISAPTAIPSMCRMGSVRSILLVSGQRGLDLGFSLGGVEERAQCGLDPLVAGRLLCSGSHLVRALGDRARQSSLRLFRGAGAGAGLIGAGFAGGSSGVRKKLGRKRGRVSKSNVGAASGVGFGFSSRSRASVRLSW